MSEVISDFDDLCEQNIRVHKRFIVAAKDILCEKYRILDSEVLAGLSVEFAGYMSRAWTETIRAGVEQDKVDAIRELADIVRVAKVEKF